MRKDVIRFELRLSEMLIIESALYALEREAVKTFNEDKHDFYSLSQIMDRTKAYKELYQLKKIFHALIEMKQKELQNEKK